MSSTTSQAQPESDAIKKVNYDNYIVLREQANCEGTEGHDFDATNTNTNCFIVSSSKVLKGYEV